MEILKGMLFKSKDEREDYGKPLEVLEVLPNDVFACSYDTDFAENTFYLTAKKLEEDYVFQEEMTDSFI